MAETGRVDFYVLAADDDAARWRFACRLAEKAYHLGHRVHLHTDSAADAARLDELLWTFRQGSFVPHEVIGGVTTDSPVTIGCEGHAPGADLLINLAESVPDFSAQFPRVAEIISGNAAARAIGRQRYRHYQGLGREPVTHHLENAS